MSGNFTVMTPEQEERLRKLEEFYREVVRLTNHHDAIVCENGITYGSVSPADLGKALEKVDTNWYSDSGQPMWGAGHGGEG